MRFIRQRWDHRRMLNLAHKCVKMPQKFVFTVAERKTMCQQFAPCPNVQKGQTVLLLDSEEESDLEDEEYDSDYSDAGLIDAVKKGIKRLVVRRAETEPPGNLVYENTSTPRGLAMIIENSEFDNLPRRDGSQADFDKMCQLLRGLGYRIGSRRKVTAREMMQFMDEFAGRPEHEAAHRWTFLANEDQGVHVHHTRDDRAGPSTRRDSSPRQRSRSRQSGPMLREPINKDYLIALSTAPNYVSLRDVTLGSRFIQSLAAVFAEHAADDDILRLMIRVYAMVSRYKKWKPNKMADSAKGE
ncbi:caspase 1, apoptosis- cysteine peptidase [Globodera pallida]|nr:caspase 1, apoptosis- cysteine peptidase [Globodera pallida]